MASFSSLSAIQKAQAQFLFADDLFGTDPEEFDYLFSKGGSVVGRTRIAIASDPGPYRRTHNINVNVTMRDMPASEGTEAMPHYQALAIRTLARRIVERLILIPVEE